MECEHTAQSLSPTVDQELGTLQEHDNYDGEVYNTTAITSR